MAHFFSIFKRVFYSFSESKFYLLETLENNLRPILVMAGMSK